MNMKSTLGEMTFTFTPDEWEQVKKLGDFAVAHVEELNRNAFEEMAGLREPDSKWWQSPSPLPAK